MKKLGIVLILGVLCLFPLTAAQGYFITSQSDPALAGGWVDDYSSWTKGTWIGLIYIGYYSFFPSDKHVRIDDTYAGYYNTTGQYLDNGDYSDEGFSSGRFTFASPVSAFGFHWGASDEQWRLDAYDAGNNLIESHNLPIVYSSNAGEFYGIAASGIKYAELVITSGGYDWVMLDDLTFKQVPIPGAVWLLGTGLLGLAGLRRRA